MELGGIRVECGLFIVTEKFLALSSQRLGNHVSRHLLSGNPHGLRKLARLSGIARPPKDNRRARETNHGAQRIPAIGPVLFDRPQPDQRRSDVDATVGGVGAARELAIDAREQACKGH